MRVAETGLLLESACPVCLGTGVRRNGSAKGFRAPAFVCPDCGSHLKASPTPRALWGIAAAAIGVLLAIAISQFARQTLHLQGTLLTVLHGGMFGALAACSYKLALRGFVYRRWER